MTQTNTVTDAAYNTVHDYPGGAPALAMRLGIRSSRVLDNKVNEKCTTHHLTLDEATKLVVFTDDLRILDAMAARAGQLVIALPEQDDVSDVALLETYTKLIKQQGQFAAVFHDALADGKITSTEYKLMHDVMVSTQRASWELLSRIDQLVED